MRPDVRLRKLLEAERRRGTQFAEAWPRALAQVLGDTPGGSWAEAFHWSASAWQRAYESRPRETIDWLEPHDLGDGQRNDVAVLA